MPQLTTEPIIVSNDAFIKDKIYVNKIKNYNNFFQNTKECHVHIKDILSQTQRLKFPQKHKEGTKN